MLREQDQATKHENVEQEQKSKQKPLVSVPVFGSCFVSFSFAFLLWWYNTYNLRDRSRGPPPKKRRRARRTPLLAQFLFGACVCAFALPSSTATYAFFVFPLASSVRPVSLLLSLTLFHPFELNTRRRQPPTTPFHISYLPPPLPPTAFSSNLSKVYNISQHPRHTHPHTICALDEAPSGMGASAPTPATVAMGCVPFPPNPTPTPAS